MPFEPPGAECRIYTFKEGLLSSFGHDLELRAERFHVDVAGEVIEARFELGAVHVARAIGASLSAGDIGRIELAMHTEVLDVARHPEARLRGRLRGDRGKGPVQVTGTLSLHGKERPLSFEAVLDGNRWHALVRLHTPDFGIAPYRAMLGALRVKPEVVVRVSLPAG